MENPTKLSSAHYTSYLYVIYASRLRGQMDRTGVTYVLFSFCYRLLLQFNYSSFCDFLWQVFVLMSSRSRTFLYRNLNRFGFRGRIVNVNIDKWHRSRTCSGVDRARPTYLVTHDTSLCQIVVSHDSR